VRRILELSNHEEDRFTKLRIVPEKMNFAVNLFCLTADSVGDFSVINYGMVRRLIQPEGL